MNDDWGYSRYERRVTIEDARTGVMRIALLFGSAAVAFALLIAPMLDRGSREYVSGSAQLDTMSTASIIKPSSDYTIRRSVLQPTPASVCIIHNDGSRIGKC